MQRMQSQMCLELARAPLKEMLVLSEKSTHMTALDLAKSESQSSKKFKSSRKK